LKDVRLSTILEAFGRILSWLLVDFIQKVVVGYGEYVMTLKRKPFSCDCCGNDREFRWKTKHGKTTKILTVYRWVELRQLQVFCKRCGHKFYITRRLLGIEPKRRVPLETYRRLGLLGALMSYRVAEKVGKMFGWAVDKMTVWGAVQKTGREIEFRLDDKELPKFPPF